MSVEIIDLRTILPWDREAVQESLEKTGRLVVVQEDSQSCSVGPMLISEITTNPQSWDTLMSLPQLVSRPDVHIGFNPIYEFAALPSADDVIAAIPMLQVVDTEWPIPSEMWVLIAILMRSASR